MGHAGNYWEDAGIRAGRVRELAKSSRSTFKMVWRQFSKFISLLTSLSAKFVQFSSGHGAKCLRSVRSVQLLQSSSRTLPALSLGLTWIAWFASGSVPSIESQIVWEEQRSSSRSLQRKSQPTGPGFVACAEGWCAFLAVLACSWCAVVSD